MVPSATEEQQLMEDLQRELIKQLKETNEYLLKALESEKEEKEELSLRIGELSQTIANLNETVEYLKRKLYGKSAEKRPDPNQLNLFDEAEKEADPSLKELSKEKMVEGYVRKLNGKSSREGVYGDIPAEKVCFPLNEEDRYCPLCKGELKKVGERFVREELIIHPAKVRRVQYYQEVYMCPKCKNEDDEFVTVEAPVPSSLIKHSLASPWSVAYIMYMKYVMAVPLYRQEQDLMQHGIRLRRGTMANWIIRCSLTYLKPVYERLHEYLKERDIIHADEVPCQVLKEPGRKPETKSYMWVYLTGDDGLPEIVLYDYRQGRKGEYAKEFLEGFHGYVHCDGYSGYNTPEDIKRVGCYAHLRRKFYDAIPIKRKAGSGMTAAEVGVEYCDRLFFLERIYKDKSKEERMEQRLAEEKPLVEEFYKWVNTLKPVKGSKLAAAVTYAKNQRQSLMNYFMDERLELSNSSAERKVKSYVIGRKNFLFHDTADGAEASAIVYSLVETAKANGLNVYNYLSYVLLNMPDYINEPEGIDEMMPWSGFMKDRCAEAIKDDPEVRLKK